MIGTSVSPIVVDDIESCNEDADDIESCNENIDEDADDIEFCNEDNNKLSVVRLPGSPVRSK